MYHAMFDAISRRRRKIAQQIGNDACRAAQTRRRAFIRERNLLVGLGGIVLQHSEESSSNSTGASRSEPAGEDFENHPR
jgi:hypothetical protein